MKTYYKDDRMWIMGTNPLGHLAPGIMRHSTLLFELDCAYMRIKPDIFQTLKERYAQNSLQFIELLYNRNVNIVRVGHGLFGFATDRDQFLFDLGFGNYEQRS